VFRAFSCDVGSYLALTLLRALCKEQLTSFVYMITINIYCMYNSACQTEKAVHVSAAIKTFAKANDSKSVAMEG